MRWTRERVEAFSDGVIAIAITLLVLELDVDVQHFRDEPWAALADEWPSYLAYLTSFLTIGGVWIVHHGVLSGVETVSPRLLRLNLVLLLLVSLLPFPTGLMADAMDGPQHAERVAVVVYGLVAVAIELVMSAMARTAAAEPPRGIRVSVRTAGYAVAIVFAVALIPRVATFAYLAVAFAAVFLPSQMGRLTLGPRHE
jgi:uncharacterized membrane protein